MEEKKVIKGFSNYEIYRDGRVYSKISDIFMKTVADKDGYKCVTLRGDDGLPHFRRVHRFLAIAFIPNPDNLPVVNHKNGVKTDNRLENLEWCTVQYNTQHAFDMGLKKFPEKLREHIVALGKSFAKRVEYTNLSTLESQVFPSLRKACEELSLNYDCVRSMKSRGKPYLSIHSFEYV